MEPRLLNISTSVWVLCTLINGPNLFFCKFFPGGSQALPDSIMGWLGDREPQVVEKVPSGTHQMEWGYKKKLL